MNRVNSKVFVSGKTNGLNNYQIFVILEFFVTEKVLCIRSCCFKVDYEQILMEIL